MARKRRQPHTVEVMWRETAKGWEVRRDGDLMWSGIEKKTEAVKYARAVARRHSAELIIKNKDGKIGRRDSYGNDPKDKPG